jgi:hypothetical protein
MKNVLENGRYELTARKIEQVRRTIEGCQRAGVPMKQVADEQGVRFVTVAELGVEHG